MSAKLEIAGKCSANPRGDEHCGHRDTKYNPQGVSYDFMRCCWCDAISDFQESFVPAHGPHAKRPNIEKYAAGRAWET